MADSQLLRLREVMDRLRSPGGCPWDAEQTHESLLKYLLEESYEYMEAVESNDREAMQEELGDVLLQVFFHARMAEDDSQSPFNVEDVARTVADKLVRRHPHVFGDTKVSSSAEVLENWEAIKAQEKGRTSATEGVPLGQPALALASKLLYRAEKFGLEIPVEHSVKLAPGTSEAQLGELLLGIIDQAVSLGLDSEAALRGAAKEYAQKIENSTR
ncbi:MAG: MazG family protein [Actinomycetes bacterium]